jgi:PAS domain S-box-containing protein
MAASEEMAASERSPRPPRATVPDAAADAAALRQTLAALGLAAWELDLRSGAARWSQVFAELHGLPASVREGTRERLLDLIHPDDRERVAQALADAPTAGAPFRVEYRAQAPGAAERWIASRGRIERDARGCPHRLLGLAEEITAAKRATAELERRERRYRELFEQSNDILYTLDLQGNFTAVNREHERVVGYSAEELLGTPVRDLVLPEYRERMAQMRDRKLGGELETTCEVGVRAKDGRAVILEVSSRLLYEDGQIVGLRGSARDTTARKQAAEALRRSEERLQRIVETAAVGILILDRRGRAVLANAAMEQIAGVGRERWEAKRGGAPPFHLLTVGGAPPPRKANPFAVVRRSGRPVYGAEFSVVRPDGGWAVVSVSAAPLHDEAGRFDGVVLIVHDVTERHRAEQELRKAIAVRNEFISIASHELRTPLTSLKGQIQLGRRRLQRGAQPEEIAIALELAEQQVNRLARLVGELLDVSRIASGRFVIAPQPVALDRLVRRVVEAERAGEPPHPIEFSSAGTEVTVHADADRLEQVLVNLIQNARKYSPPGSPIRVGLQADADAVTIAVQDRGIGVPEDEQERIFQPFQRASNVDRGISGLGLGLHIAAEIVRAHGGVLAVASRPGAGSTFSVRLPLGSGPDAGAAE